VAENKDDDLAFFRNAMKNVKPLHNDKIVLTKPLPKKKAYIEEQENINKDILYDHNIREVETEEELLFKRTGIQHYIINKLRRGQFNIQAELDLHGMTVRVAQQEVKNFLKKCQYRDIRCARIIHGKGYGSTTKQPILKNKLNLWLPQCDEILAFCSARPSDGGTGAVYVLIKRL
jgi:DNA-nicking Smr family endonuclease